MQGESAAPTERQASAAFCATRVTSARSRPASARGAGDLEGVDHAGDAAALLALLGRRGGDVVGEKHRRRFDVLHLDEVARHVEVHHVATVVAVEAQDAGALVRGADRVGHLLGRGRGEDVADGAGVEQSLAHVAREDRQMPRAAARDDADLAEPPGLRPRDHPVAVSVKAVVLGVGRDEAVEHFVDVVGGTVQDFFIVSPFWARVVGQSVDEDKASAHR